MAANPFNRRILVVDDNPKIHEDFRKIFCVTAMSKVEAAEASLFGEAPKAKRETAFDLSFASQGQEALDLAHIALKEGRPYAMAFMDVRMPPGWDGIETISKIWEVDPAMQVAICTAFSDYSLDAIAARLHHSDSFVILKKPFDIVEVMQLASAFTEKWNLSRSVEERSRRLQESEQRYRFLADAVPGIVWTAKPDGSVDYANRRVQEYAGKTFEQIRDWGWKDFLHPDDVLATTERWTGCLKTGVTYQIEYRLQRAADKSWRWHLARAIPLRNAKGEILQWIGTATDIDDQKRAEAVLRQSQAELERRVAERTQELAHARVRFEHLLRSSPAIIYARKADGPGDITFVSQNAAAVLGLQPAEFLADPQLWLRSVHPDDASVLRAHRFQLLVGEHHSAEYRFKHKDGSYRWLHDEGRAIRDARGAPIEVVGSCVDITQRKQMEQQLRLAKDELERRVTERTAELQAAVLKTQHALEELAQQKFALDQHAIVAVTDVQGKITYVNNRFCAISQYSRDELMGQDHRMLNSGTHTKEFFISMYQTISRGQVWHGEMCNRAKDGSLYWLNTTIVPFLGPGGKPQQYVAIRTDITALKRAEATHALLAAIVQSSDDAIYSQSLDGVVTSWNKGAENIFGFKADEIVGKSITVLIPQELASEEISLIACIRNDKCVEHHETTRVRKDGRRIPVSLTISPLKDASGRIVGASKIARDITESKQAAEQIQKLNAELELRVTLRTAELEKAVSELAYERDLLGTLMGNSADYIYFKDRQSRFIRCSKTLAARFGISRVEDMVGKTDFDFYDEEHARPAFEDEQQIMRTGQPLIGKVEKESRKGGSEVSWALTNKMPLRNNAGEIIGTFGISKDVTSMKDAENSRQMMELQLRQAQKLEAIGQLAAGIAHEINTPTQYVGDNTRFLKDSFDSIAKALRSYDELLGAARTGAVTPELVSRVEEALKACDLAYLFEQIPAAIRETLEGVERVTKIVRAMKEFSHPGGKEKTAVDLNKAIETTSTVARNEWKYVANLKLDLDPSLPAVPCFLGEFNQVILNLIVNASHAIGDVIKQNPGSMGTITVQTRRDGDQVEIRVSDTGTGIPESVRPKIFEPFFTTKEVGKGTGQGLSIVYGSIVKKHGGTVGFETETGKGTTFILRLPINPSAEIAARKDEKPASARFDTMFKPEAAPGSVTQQA